jgi:hypothetical protein
MDFPFFSALFLFMHAGPLTKLPVGIGIAIVF